MKKKSIFEKKRVSLDEVIDYLVSTLYVPGRTLLTKSQKEVLKRFEDRIPENLTEVYLELVDPDEMEYAMVLEEEYADTPPIPWDDTSREWLDDAQ